MQRISRSKLNLGSKKSLRPSLILICTNGRCGINNSLPGEVIFHIKIGTEKKTQWIFGFIIERSQSHPIYVLIEISDRLINKASGFYGATEEDAEEE